MILVTEQEDAIKPILEAVSGMTTVFTDFPDAVEQRRLPAIVLSPRDATYDRDTYGADSLLVRRQWLAVLLVKLAVEGREYQSEQEAKPFLDSVPLALAAYPTITLDDDRVFQMELHQGGDRGARPVLYNGKQFVGSIFTFYTLTEGTVDPVDTI